MDELALRHVLTEGERAAFERDGYLVVPEALGSEQLERLLAAADAVRLDLQREHAVDARDRTLLLDFIGLHDEFLELIDWLRVFPKVWGILGWNVQLYHSHLCTAPPMPDDGRPSRQHYLHRHNPALNTSHELRSPKDVWGWHRDGGRLNFELGPPPHPRISLKVAYFLTDTTNPAAGSMHVVPASHRDPYLEVRNVGEQPYGATPVCVRAGTAVIFDRRIWHSAAPNTAAHTRKVLFYGYSYRWLRPRDDMTVEHYLADADPVRRQLLNYAKGAYGYSSPDDDEVPLKCWLAQHGLAETGSGIPW